MWRSSSATREIEVGSPDQPLHGDLGERRHHRRARVVEHVAQIVVGGVALPHVAQRPVLLDERRDRRRLALPVRNERNRVGMPRIVVRLRPCGEHHDRNAKAPGGVRRAGRRRNVVVPPAGVVPRDDHCAVLIVVALRRRVAALHERQIHRADPSRAARAQAAGVIGVEVVRHDERHLRKPAARDVAQHRARRRDDVALPVAAVTDLSKRVVDVHRRIGHVVVASGVVLPRDVRRIEQIGDRQLIEARKCAGRDRLVARRSEQRHRRSRFRVAAPDRIVGVARDAALRGDQRVSGSGTSVPVEGRSSGRRARSAPPTGDRWSFPSRGGTHRRNPAAVSKSAITMRTGTFPKPSILPRFHSSSRARCVCRGSAGYSNDTGLSSIVPPSTVAPCDVSAPG